MLPYQRPCFASFIVSLLCIFRVTFCPQSWMCVLRTRILPGGAQLMSVGQVSAPFPHFLLWTWLVSEEEPRQGGENRLGRLQGNWELRGEPWEGASGGMEKVGLCVGRWAADSGSRSQSPGMGQRGCWRPALSSEGSSCGHLWPPDVPHPLGKPHPLAGLRTCPAPGCSRKGARWPQQASCCSNIKQIEN